MSFFSFHWCKYGTFKRTDFHCQWYQCCYAKFKKFIQHANLLAGSLALLKFYTPSRFVHRITKSRTIEQPNPLFSRKKMNQILSVMIFQRVTRTNRKYLECCPYDIGSIDTIQWIVFPKNGGDLRL